MPTTHVKNTTMLVSSTQFFSLYSWLVAVLRNNALSNLRGTIRRSGMERDMVEQEVLDELYDLTELHHGARIQYPWRGKGGNTTHWSAIFVDPEQE